MDIRCYQPSLNWAVITPEQERALRKALSPARRDLAKQSRGAEVFHGLVVIAQVKHPIPSRTRQLSTVAPMVLRLKAWESRSPPNLVKPLKENVSLFSDAPHNPKKYEDAKLARDGAAR